MKKTIVVGGSRYEINFTQETATQVLNMLINWMEEKEHYASDCGEGIMQDDNCQIDAPVLISDMVDKVLQPKFIEEI